MSTLSLPTLLGTSSRNEELRFGTHAPDPQASEDFSSLLGRAGAATGASPEDRARKAAEQIVAVALVQPVLKQLRESSQAAPPFAPTQGEKQFQSLMDAQVAQQVVQAKRFGLVDRVQEMLLKKSGAGLEVQA